MEDKPRYFSYLLRVWLAEEGSPPQWRASPEDTLTRERQGFASLEDACRYLKEQARLNAGEKEANQKENKTKQQIIGTQTDF